MLKLGYNEATCMENSTLDTDLLLCEANGYDYIELRIDMLRKYLENHSLQELKDFFATHKLKPFSINSIENINFCSEEQWKQIETDFMFACEVANSVGAPNIVVVPTVTDSVSTIGEKEVYEDSVKVLNTMVQIAKPYNIKIAFEPIGDKRWVCNSLRQGLEIVEAVNKPNVGLVVDCINFYMHDKCSDVDFIRKVPKDKLFVYHINDCEDLPLGILDHCHRLMPGKGCIPVKEISEAVKSVGYDGPACLELFRPEYWQMAPEAVFELGAKTSRKFL